MNQMPDTSSVFLGPLNASLAETLVLLVREHENLVLLSAVWVIIDVDTIRSNCRFWLWSDNDFSQHSDTKKLQSLGPKLTANHVVIQSNLIKTHDRQREHTETAVKQPTTVKKRSWLTR